MTAVIGFVLGFLGAMLVVWLSDRLFGPDELAFDNPEYEA